MCNQDHQAHRNNNWLSLTSVLDIKNGMTVGYGLSSVAAFSESIDSGRNMQPSDFSFVFSSLFSFSPFLSFLCILSHTYLPPLDLCPSPVRPIQVNPVLGHTLFRVSNTSECRSGERVILSRYLGDVHTFHHLITTQVLE